MHGEEEGYGMTLAMAPASLAEHFHLCVPGGYIMHIMNVVKCSGAVEKLYKAMAGAVTWTEEERVLSCLLHDLGKLGDPELGEYYKPEDNDWKRKQGNLYKLNPEIQYMNATDRTFYVMQRFGVTCNWKEYLAIMLADGLYREGNEKYLKTYNKDMSPKTNLHLIVHQADILSTFAERDLWKSGNK